MLRIGIALGSNIGNRLQFLASARASLIACAGVQRDLRVAPVFVSKPVNCPPGSPDFLNTAMEIDVSGQTVMDFFFRCQEIEAALGRPPPAGRDLNSPRPIDIDLLYLGRGTYESAMLVLPHPRMCSRAFVLLPLAEIAPQRIPGGHTRTIAALLAALPPDPQPPQLFAQNW